MPAWARADGAPGRRRRTGPLHGPDGQTWLPNDLPAESAYHGPVTGNEKPIISELCTGNSQWDAPAPAPYLDAEPSTISYRPATSTVRTEKSPEGLRGLDDDGARPPVADQQLPL